MDEEKLRLGSIVVLSDEGLDNYADAEWAAQPLKISHVATKYMPATEFFAKGMPLDYHPGYDEEMNGGPLYDFVDAYGKDIPNSMYWWEIEPANNEQKRVWMKLKREAKGTQSE